MAALPAIGRVGWACGGDVLNVCFARP
jgi:hypothetical protein